MPAGRLPPPLDPPLLTAYPGPNRRPGKGAMFGRIRPMTGERVRRTCVGLLAACAVVLGSSATASATPLSYTLRFEQSGLDPESGSGEHRLPARGLSINRRKPREATCRRGTPEPRTAAPATIRVSCSPSTARSSPHSERTTTASPRSTCGPSADPAINSPPRCAAAPAGDSYLDGFLPIPVRTDYNHLSIPLNETANWRGVRVRAAEPARRRARRSSRA